MNCGSNRRMPWCDVMAIMRSSVDSFDSSRSKGGTVWMESWARRVEAVISVAALFATKKEQTADSRQQIYVNNSLKDQKSCESNVANIKRRPFEQQTTI